MGQAPRGDPPTLVDVRIALEGLVTLVTGFFLDSAAKDS
jgi:hypothetical protein